VKRTILFTLIVILVGLSLVACGSSQAKLNAQATEIVASIFATQTAGAPSTATPTFTPTLTPTATDTPTATFTPSPTATPSPTQTPTPSKTPTRTPSPTLTPTPTPKPDAIVKVKSGNLRAGPGTTYAIIGKVGKGDAMRIIGKNPASNWVQIILSPQSGGKKGWLWVNLLILNKPLSKVSVAANIPPSPTPRATPTPRMCSPNSAFIKFSNQLDVTLTLRLAGPYPATIILRPRSSRNICLVPGSYSVTASARGFINYHATYQYHTGPCQCNIFGTFVIPGSCNCSQNHAYYSPP